MSFTGDEVTACGIAVAEDGRIPADQVGDRSHRQSWLPSPRTTERSREYALSPVLLGRAWLAAIMSVKARRWPSVQAAFAFKPGGDGHGCARFLAARHPARAGQRFGRHEAPIEI